MTLIGPRPILCPVSCFQWFFVILAPSVLPRAGARDLIQTVRERFLAALGMTKEPLGMTKVEPNDRRTARNEK